MEQLDFAWDGSALAEQTRAGGVSEDADRGDARATVWDYAPGSFRPLTQRERPPLRDASQPWIDEQFHAIITDLVGTPTELINDQGDIAWTHRTTLWGQNLGESRTGTSTPLRFPGQYADPETGLNYNYFRHYDPDTGRYTSTDPLGLDAGPNPHVYVANPSGLIDPLGLQSCTGIGLEQASSLAFKAAEKPHEIFIKNKHLSDFGGRYRKFDTTDPQVAQQWVADGLKTPDAIFKPNQGDPDSFQVFADLGRSIGTKGESTVKVLVNSDGEVFNAFPVKNI